jgi:hypothetical protein
MAIVLKSSETSSLSGLTVLRRDQALLAGDGGGVRFAFDLAFGYSWPPLAAGTSGDVVLDTADVGNGSLVRTGTGTTYAGGGFDYNALTGGDDYVQAPSGCLSGINGGNEYFLVSAWMKLPAQADWRTGAGLSAIFHTAAGAYTAGPDMVTIGESLNNQITARRQTDGGSTIDTIFITADAAIWGQVCQIGYWRNAAGTGLRVRSALGQKLVTGAVGTANSGNFGATQPKWGSTPAFSNFTKGRLFRGHVEDLQVSGRNPTTVLDADFAATIARGVFS